MPHVGSIRQQTFQNYQDQPREQDYVWNENLPKDQGLNGGTTQ